MKTNDNLVNENDPINESCFWELNLYTGELDWSDGLCQLLGITKPYTPTLEQLVRYLQPEQNIRPALNRAIHQGVPFVLKLPVLADTSKVITVYTTASPVYDDYGKCIAIKGVLSTENLETSAETIPFVADALEEQTLMFKNFSRIVSHNLRSHTSNLQMVLESVHQKASSQEMRSALGNIKTISHNLNQTVGYLNTLIKI